MSIVFRKLNVSENGITRALWEEIFSSDTKVFLDYYYSVKTKTNEIYAAFDEEKLCAMLQLNPYVMQLGDKEVVTNYIIAVATDKKYRKQGIMGALLTMALHEMQKRKEPFTFLMPAAEAIYYPYAFRYMYKQKQGMVCGRESVGDVVARKAQEEDFVRIARFVSAQLKRNYSVYAVRDTAYYATLHKEQVSENGGILMALRGDKLTGCLLYAKEEEVEIREPIFEEAYADDFLHTVFHLTGSEEKEVKCMAWGSKEVPMIMARILDLETFFASVRLQENADFYVRMIDEQISENQGIFRIFGKKGQRANIKREENGFVSDEVEAVNVAALTSYLFGYKDWEEIIKEEKLVLSGRMVSNLEKMMPVSPVFLNEIV